MINTAVRLRRSVLYVPGANERALEKARGLEADCLVFDLEDAVGPSMKAHARALVVEALRASAFEGRETVVRVNAPESPEGMADLEAALACAPDAIALPKVEDVGVIERICAVFDQAEARRGLALWAMIETPKAVLNLAQIAALGARRRLAALMVGANDLGASLRLKLSPDRRELAHVLTQTVVAARAHGLAAIDAVYNNHRDLTGFAAEARQARAFGFDGKALIHPDQIALAHQAFRPSDEEIAWARRVVAAFRVPENLEKGAIAVDGKMVERLHLDDAQRLLKMAGVSAEPPAAAQPPQPIAAVQEPPPPEAPAADAPPGPPPYAPPSSPYDPRSD